MIKDKRNWLSYQERYEVVKIEYDESSCLDDYTSDRRLSKGY